MLWNERRKIVGPRATVVLPRPLTRNPPSRGQSVSRPSSEGGSQAQSIGVGVGGDGSGLQTPQGEEADEQNREGKQQLDERKARDAAPYEALNASVSLESHLSASRRDPDVTAPVDADDAALDIACRLVAQDHPNHPAREVTG
jgi:hypothetical protein